MPLIVDAGIIGSPYVGFNDKPVSRTLLLPSPATNGLEVLKYFGVAMFFRRFCRRVNALEYKGFTLTAAPFIAVKSSIREAD